MSLPLEDDRKENETEDVLEQILVQLKLLNLQIREAFDTSATEDDI